MVVEEAGAPLVVVCIAGTEVQSGRRDRDGGRGIRFGEGRVVESERAIEEGIFGVVNCGVAERDRAENVGFVADACSICSPKKS